MQVKWLGGLITKIKEKKSLKWIITIAAIIILITVGVVIMLLVRGGNSQKSNFSFGGGRPGGNMAGGMSFNMSGEMITASGVTSIGVTEESFDVENLTTSLEIEEVYINSEDEITEGTKVLKLSEESITNAREELEKTLRDAELAYRSGVIEYEQSKINAEYERDSAILAGKQAKAVYDETIANLDASVENAQEELDQAREDIAEYQSYVNTDTYKSYFNLDKYQAIYDETLSALIIKMEEWGVSWPQVTGQGGMANTEEARVLANLYKVLEDQRKDLDEAQSEYDNAIANAAFELQTLELKLPQLENALMEANKDYKEQFLQAEITYETSLLNAENAERDYETAIEQAETTYESLEKDYTDAKENIELFEKSVGDGYYYAQGNGTVLRLIARAGRTLSSEGIIFMYSNPEEITVTVSVDQTDISKIAIGDSAYVMTSTTAGFEGVVTELNPISSSTSRTSVSYNVTVQLKGDTANVGSNETVSVMFGVDSNMFGDVGGRGDAPQQKREEN